MDGYLVYQKNLSEPELNDSLEALDTEWQIFFIILYSLISILALCENLLVIFVQLFGKNFEKILRKCLINLAIADISIGVLSAPFSYTDFMLGHWIFPHFMCPLSQFALLLAVFVTTYTLTLISLESLYERLNLLPTFIPRYIAVVHPVFHANKCNVIESSSSLLLLIGWILGSLLSALTLIHCKVREFKWNGDTYYDCRIIYNSELEQKAYILLLFILTFLLPLVLQATFYLRIALKIKNSKATLFRDKIRLTKMLALLVLLFAICWLPIKLFFLVVIFNKEMVDFHTKTTAYHVYVFTYFIAHCLAMFSSCINPIVYCFMSKSFRDDFWHLMGRTRSQTN